MPFIPVSMCRVLALLLAGLGAAVFAWAEPVCEIVALKGRAQWSLAGQAGDVRPSQGLEVGTELWTGAASRLKLRCIDGSTLVLGDQSRLQIEYFEAPPGQPRLASWLLSTGLLGQKVQPDPQGRWQVRTPTAVTAVRGTEFLVEVAANQSTAVQVLSGSVAVESLDEDAAGSSIGGFSSKGTRGVLARPRAETLLEGAGAHTHCQSGQGCKDRSEALGSSLQGWRERLGDL